MKEKIIELLQTTLKNLKTEPVEVVVNVPLERTHGDFATPLALQLAKIIKESPTTVAEKVVEALPKNDLVLKTEIVAPGFINFFVKDEQLINYFSTYQRGKITLGEGKKAVTDSSHPNIAKPIGVHHLLSTIIGASFNNLLAFCGYTVVRDNFLGDFGTQFGKALYAYKQWGDQATVQKNPIPELLKLYVEFHNRAEKDPTLEDAARAEFKKLEDGDPENKKLWGWMVEISMQEINKIYEQLGVHFDVIHGESFYEDKMAEILELGKKKGVFTIGEKGALVCEFPKEMKLPTCVIQKSDGATLYHTRDLARTLYWEREYHPDLMVITTDVAQELHFKQLFAIVKKLELTQAENVHIHFGRMQFKDRAMSTRKGNILELQEVLDEALVRTKQLFQTKEVDFPPEEIEQLAKIIGIGAVKYAILSQNRNTNIIFDWDKIISLEGNSGPYLQYTYTRGMSILKKADSQKTEQEAKNLEPAEKELILHLLQFNETVVQATKEFKPNVLANYLYQLAQLFNSFYNKLSVLNAEPDKQNLRLKLVQDSCRILQVGLDLLGIQVPDRM